MVICRGSQWFGESLTCLKRRDRARMPRTLTEACLNAKLHLLGKVSITAIATLH